MATVAHGEDDSSPGDIRLGMSTARRYNCQAIFVYFIMLVILACRLRSPFISLPSHRLYFRPRIHQIMKIFRATPVSQTQLVSSPAQSSGVLKPKAIVGIPLDLQPKIVNVPKQSISDAYRR